MLDLYLDLPALGQPSMNVAVLEGLIERPVLTWMCEHWGIVPSVDAVRHLHALLLHFPPIHSTPGCSLQCYMQAWSSPKDLPDDGTKTYWAGVDAAACPVSALHYCSARTLDSSPWPDLWRHVHLVKSWASPVEVFPNPVPLHLQRG